MAVPNPNPVILYLNNTDVTAYAPFADMRLDDMLRDVSSFRFVLENPPVTPLENDDVLLIGNYTGFPTRFVGKIIELDESKIDNGIMLRYEIDAADRKYRLQKSFVPPNDYVGLDSAIIADLFTDTYPDLTSLFDYVSEVDNLASGVNLPTNDESLLDSLKNLSDKSGGTYSFEKGDNLTGDIVWTFGDVIDPIEQSDPNSLPIPVPSWYVTALGNSAFPTDGHGNPSGWGLSWVDELENFPVATHGRVFSFVFAFSNESRGLGEITSVDVDYYIDCIEATSNHYIVINNADGSNLFSDTNAPVNGVWTTVNATGSITGYRLAIEIGITIPGGLPNPAPYDIRLDNIVINGNNLTATLPDKLKWQGTPDPAPFDIDIDLSDEYAFDIDLKLGNYDKFNSVIVTGGTTNESIDWIYHNSGVQDHFALESPVDSIAVYVNTGHDDSLTWTAQDVGTWGVDELGVAGIDVLYDKVNNWLYFDTPPPNLTQSFRVTGTIKKPIRVLVENYNEGDPILATSIHDESITSEAEAISIGYAELNQYASIRYLKFKTYERGLSVGQSMTVTDSARGLAESTLITRIQTEWIGSSGHALFEVECGDDNAGGLDTMIANIDKRSREKASTLGLVASSTTYLLTDDSGDVMTDNSGNVFYEVV